MNQSPAEIEQDIEATRQAVDRTVEALKEKMSPSNLMQSLVRGVGDRGSEMMGSVARVVQRNPAPFAVAGLGLALWYFGARRASAHRRSVHAELGETMHDATLGAAQATKAVAHNERHVERTLLRTIADEPLLVGAAALAIGAAAAAALPSSAVERRYVRPLREKAMEGLRGAAAHRGYQSARTGAEAAAE